jgi:hypothetical protein
LNFASRHCRACPFLCRHDETLCAVYLGTHLLGRVHAPCVQTRKRAAAALALEVLEGLSKDVVPAATSAAAASAA